MVEYILIMAVVCIGLILALALFRDPLGNGVDNARTSLESVSGTSKYVPGGSGSVSTGQPGGGSGVTNGRGRGRGGSGRGGGGGN
jgi:hypothetical protein